VAACALACGLALPATPVHALPTDPEAKAHLEKGTELFKAGEFDAAIAEYKQGYEKQEDPVFLYAWAQAELRQEHCAAAVKLYRKYLETNPPEMSAEAARQGILECADKLAADDTSAPSDDPTTTAVDDDSQPVDDTPPEDTKPPRQKKGIRDPLGISLTTIGIAGLGAGIGVLVAGLVEKKKSSETYGEFDDRQARARNLTIAGAVVIPIGVGLLAGGIVRLALVRRANKRNTSVSALLWPGSAGIVFSGRF